MLIATEAWDDAALTSLLAAATLLGTDVKMGIYTNVITPNKDTVLADLTEPTWATYVRQSVTFGPAIRDPNNGIASLSLSILWQQSGTPTPCLIQGYFLAYGATLKLLGAENLPAPFQMNDILDAFSVQVEYLQTSARQAFASFIL